MITPSTYARAQRKMHQRMQKGTVLSWTRIAHPPEGFSKEPYVIGLMELEDGTQSFGRLLADTPSIGQHVVPRMRHLRTNAEGLRIYDVVYESAVEKYVETFEESVFPRYILAITGPSGVGKSTVSTLLGKVYNRSMKRVPILTTREPKEGDDGEYCYISRKEFALLQKEGKLATSAKIPSKSEDRHYGYRIEDIEAIWKKGRIPVVVTEMHLLEGLAAHFGRRSILSFGLLPPGKSRRAMLSHLLFRLRKRGRENDVQIQERLKNAVKDIRFFTERAELFDHILVNEDLEMIIKAFQKHGIRAV